MLSCTWLMSDIQYSLVKRKVPLFQHRPPSFKIMFQVSIFSQTKHKIQECRHYNSFTTVTFLLLFLSYRHPSIMFILFFFFNLSSLASSPASHKVHSHELCHGKHLNMWTNFIFLFYFLQRILFNVRKGFKMQSYSCFLL